MKATMQLTLVNCNSTSAVKKDGPANEIHGLLQRAGGSIYSDSLNVENFHQVEVLERLYPGKVKIQHGWMTNSGLTFFYHGTDRTMWHVRDIPAMERRHLRPLSARLYEMENGGKGATAEMVEAKIVSAEKLALTDSISASEVAINLMRAKLALLG